MINQKICRLAGFPKSVNIFVHMARVIWKVLFSIKLQAEKSATPGLDLNHILQTAKNLPQIKKKEF